MNRESVAWNGCTFEVLAEGDAYRGLGAIRIGETQVRSGRLPLAPYTQTFSNGTELAELRLEGIETGENELRIRLEAIFRPLPVKIMRDHSFDPIHDLEDWDGDAPAGTGRLEVVIRPAEDRFGENAFTGFAYHYEYASEDTPIFYLYDRASWELDGDIAGATVYNQSACSAPVVRFEPETFWTTEGYLFFLDEGSHANRCMTHNLPRWTDHQCFDHQVKGDRTLLGVFEHVDLVRTVLRRDAGKPELKCFDKHIFDEALARATTPKRILLNTDPKTETDQKNLWTWIYDETARRARDEFGLREQPPELCMGHHHWKNYTIDTYYRDIVPACAAVGVPTIFAENFKRNDQFEPDGIPGGNMCLSREYEVSDRLGGTVRLKSYIDRCREHGIRNFMWTNTYVSLAAELNSEHRCGPGSWFMAMEDTRLKYAGAYTSVSSNLDLKNPEARTYWVDCHRRIVEETGLEGYFIDSHYNLFFMPVNYSSGHPQTSWRESLEVLRELQETAGVEWQIESFGPFGRNIHGHPDSYDAEVIFICYHVGLGNNTVTVPVPGSETTKNDSHDPAFLYYQLAHKSPARAPLFIDGKRIDEVYGEEHRRIIHEYHAELPGMHRRYLQEDGNAVLYHDAAGTRATIWNFVEQTVALPGTVTDLTTGEVLAPSDTYALAARHTYAVTDAAELPTRLGD